MAETEQGNVLRGLSDALAGAVETAGGSVVAIHARRRIPSSGVVWQEGLIVTASHTLEREEDITVTWPDGTSTPASIAGRDAGTDLAVVRPEGGSAVVAQQADADALRVGTLVLALGRPWDAGVTASLGVISAVGGEWRTWHGGRIDRRVRLDLAIHDGFSGGPLVGADARVLGINTSGLGRGAPMTVPASTVERVATELATRGRVRRGDLGLAMQPVILPPGLQERAEAAETGLLVLHVEPDGPAAAAGALIGDVIVAIGGRTVSDLRELAGALAADTIGQSMTVRALRGGEPVSLDVQIAERPGREV